MGPFLGVTFWQSPRHSAPQRKQLPTHPHSPQSALPKSFAVGGPEVGRQPVLWRAKEKAPPSHPPALASGTLTVSRNLVAQFPPTACRQFLENSWVLFAPSCFPNQRR